MKITNPADGTTITEVTADNATAVQRKYELARAGQPKWAKVPLKKRLAIIAAFRERIVAMRETLARTLTHEVGKPIRQSRNELNGFLGRIDFFLAESARMLRDEKVFADAGQKLEERIAHEPLGVIANISAWNYPYFVGGNVFVPALLAGNAVLYKPSEFATLTGMHIAELLHEAGVPHDAFVPVIGEGAAGAALLRQPVDAVFFTGSLATGAKIAARAGERMIKVQLELGGKDPIYVCEDVDVAAAAAAVADGAFYNTGQSCCSVERIYVHEKIHDAFVRRFCRRSPRLQAGRPDGRDDLHRRHHAAPAARRAEEAGRGRQTQGCAAPPWRQCRQAQGQLVRADRVRRRRPFDVADEATKASARSSASRPSRMTMRPSTS